MPSAQHLRPEHPLEARPVLVRQRSVRQRSHTVDYPAERRQPGFRADPRHQPFHRRGVRHVVDLDPHRRAARPQPDDLLRRRRVRGAAAVQHHRAGAGVEQPPGDREADAAQPAGHQHAAVPAHASPVRGLSPPRRRRRPRRPDEAGRPPRLPPMRDLDLPVRPEELRRQLRRRRRPLRVQVQEPHGDVRKLARHRAPEPPEHRSGEGAAALLSERLTAPGHEPQPRARLHSRVLEPLRQRQRAARHPLHVLPERRRGRIRSRTRHPAEMRDPAKFARRKSPEELAPPVTTGAVRLRRHDHPLPLRLEFPDQFLPERGLPRPHHPEAGVRRRLRRAAGQQHPRGLRHGSRFSLAHDRTVPEPRLRQHPPPSGRIEQRVLLPVAIREPPPAGQQAEGQIQPAAGLHHLERQQQPRRRQQPAAVRERLPEVARRVQHVRGDHQIEAVRLEPLFARVALDVQHPEVQTRLAPAETFRRRRQEARRHVGEHVVRPPSGQRGQQRFGGSPGPRPDLQHPEAATRRERRDRRRGGFPDRLVHRPQPRRVPVQVRRVRLAAEQQVEGIRPAPQHFGQRPPAAAEQSDLHRTAGTTPEQFRRLRFRILPGWRPPGLRTGGDPPFRPGRPPDQQAGGFQQREHPPQHPALPGNHPESAGQGFGLHRRSGPPRPPQFLERPERERTGERLQAAPQLREFLRIQAL